jgi:hypothetical protein
MTRAWSTGGVTGTSKTSPVASVSKVQAHLRDAARFRRAALNSSNGRVVVG